MKSTWKIKETFKLLTKDGKIYFLILASFLMSIPAFINSSDFLTVLLIRAIPQSFAWLIIAWIITDITFVRKPAPYLIIFFLMFIDQIYYSLFNNFYPEIYDKNQTFDIHLIFVFIKIIITLFFIILFWYLSRPKEFTEKKYDFIKNRKMIIVFLATFFMCLMWLYYPIYLITGFHPLSLLSQNIELFNWYSFIFTGIPMAIGMVLFAIIITNIKTKAKYNIYGVIGFFTLFQTIPFVYYLNFVEWTVLTVDIYQFVISFISWFFVFLGLLLVSKNKYI